MVHAAYGRGTIASSTRIILKPLAEALAWLGRQSTRAIAVAILIAILLPPLSTLLKPYVTEAVFLLLFTAFLRVDADALRGHIKRPGLVLAGTAWTALAIPALFAIVCIVTGAETAMPDLYTALMLQAITSPIMSSPAFALIMGLDATLVLAVLVTSSAVTPVTAALFAALMGLGLDLSPLALGAQLFVVVAGSALLAFIVRRIAGVTAIERHREEINGFSIVLLFVFAVAIMENVGATFLARPLMMTALTIFSFVVVTAILIVSLLALMKTGRRNALALAFLSSQRNMGLMLAATGGAVPELAWLYFAVAQFPIYLSPYLFTRPVAWLLARENSGVGD